MEFTKEVIFLIINIEKDLEQLFENLAKKYNLVVLSGDNDGERRILEKMLPEKTQLVFNQKPEEKLTLY